jgi:hypothetical protein
VSPRYDVPGRVALTRIERADRTVLCRVVTLRVLEAYYETIVSGAPDDSPLRAWCARRSTREGALEAHREMVARVIDHCADAIVALDADE